MRTLPPQKLSDSTWAGIEKQLKWIFYELLFAPLLAIINQETQQQVELVNAGSFSALLDAIRGGRIQYADGKFFGHFNVRISNALRLLGAKYNPKQKIFQLPVELVPGWLKAEAANYQDNARQVHDELQRKLNEMQLSLDERLKEFNVDASGALDKIQSGFRKSAEALVIQPKLDEARSAQLARDYNDNIKLYIKDFAQQSIGTLRESVEDNAMQGYRFDRLKDVIQQRYGVTANKAAFLARNETSIFMSTYRKQRFSQAGVRQYKWSTAHDERVRDDHKRLNGRIFSYDNPPITDRSSGAKNNPGMDYNCRCLDIPLLDKIVEYV